MSGPDAGRARILLDAGSVRAALEEAGRVLTAEPDDPDALTVVADARRRLGDARGGLAAAERAAALAPDDPDVSRALAFARLGVHDKDGAVEAARRSVDRLPADPVPLANLSSVLLATDRRRHVAEALRAAEAAIATAPDDPMIMLAYGNALRSARRTAEAQDVFRRILALAPQDFLARHNLAAGSIDPRRGPVDSVIAMSDLVGERPDLALVQHNMRVAAGNLLLRAQSTTWAGWVAFFAVLRLSGVLDQVSYGTVPIPAPGRIALVTVACAVLLALVGFTWQGVVGLGSRAAAFGRFLLRRDRAAVANAVLAGCSALALAVAAVVPQQWVPAMFTGVALLLIAAIVAFVRRRQLGRSLPSPFVDS